MIVHFLPRFRPTTFKAVIRANIADGKDVVIVSSSRAPKPETPCTPPRQSGSR